LSFPVYIITLGCKQRRFLSRRSWGYSCISNARIKLLQSIQFGMAIKGIFINVYAA